MLEKNIQKNIVAFCKEHSIIAVKVDSTSTRGWPDLTVITPDGEVHFVEIKTSTGVRSPLQVHIHKRLREQNANVTTVRSLEDFISYLKRKTDHSD